MYLQRRASGVRSRPRVLSRTLSAVHAPLQCMQGFVVLCSSVDEAVSVCDTIAPEHLEVQMADADAVWRRINNYGGMFVGTNTAGACGACAAMRFASCKRGELLCAACEISFGFDWRGSLT